MIEVIKRHLAERNMLKTAGLSLCYLEKKGEEKCVRAAEAIIQNEVMDVIPSLWEQVCLYMMEDPETITYLGNLKKEGCELNAYRFQRILLDAGTDKVSDFSYEQVKAECTNATPDCKILVPNVYKVITKDASKAGDVALGYFYCQHIKTGKGAGGTFSIKCAANGAVTIS